MKRILALVSLGLMCGQLHAGYVFTMDVSGKDGKDARKVEMAVEDGSLKISTGQDSASLIFQGSTNTLVLLNAKKKQYSKLDEETVAKLSQALTDAKAQMEQALKDVPAAQKAMMQRMMPKLPEPTGVPTYKVEETGETETIGGYKAEKVVVTANGEKVSEMWLAPLKAVDGAKDLLESTKEFSTFFTKLMSNVPGMDQANSPFNAMMMQMATTKGFPVLTKSFENGKLASVTKLVDVEKKDIADSEFAPPAGYKEQKIEVPSL